MKFSVTSKTPETDNFFSITKLITATVIVLSAFLFAGPLVASASPAVWTDNEVASSLNLGNYAIVNSVSCTSSTSCVAGGNYQDGSNHTQAFVSVYNGSSWVDHEVAASLNAGNNALVNSVSCTSSTSCVAGGQYLDGNNHRQAFVSVYNGSTWVDHEVGAALNAGNYAYVNSVSCTSSTSCVVGGQYTDGNNNNRAFVSSATLTVTHARVSGTVYFASGSSTLSMSAKRTLNTIASQIVSRSQSSVTLNGYASPGESRPATLSLRRANSVKTYLQTKLSALGHSGVTFVVHARGVTRSGSSYAKDRKVTLS